MAVAAPVSVEEYLSASWDPDREYVDGQLVERNVGELDHSYLQFRIAKILDGRGLLPFTELRVQVRAGSFRIPDILAVTEMPKGRFLKQPPYIVVEVLSRQDRLYDVDEKIDDYLAFGVPNIWIVYPHRRNIEVRTGGNVVVCIDTVETSDGRISIPLSEIFGQMPSVEE